VKLYEYFKREVCGWESRKGVRKQGRYFLKRYYQEVGLGFSSYHCQDRR